MTTIGYEPGWAGAFTRDHAPGAYPSGTRIVKVREEDGDSTPIGTGGTVLGSLDGTLVEYLNPEGGRVWHFYFVEWDNRPRTAVGVMDWKVEAATA